MDVVYTADRAHNRVHRRTREGRTIALVGTARCPWNPLGELELVLDHDVVANADPDRLCGKCWPQIKGDW